MLIPGRRTGGACQHPHIIQARWEFQPNGSQLSKVLQRLTVPIIDREKCRMIYAGYLPVTSNMLCAGNGETDTCQVRFQWPINVFLFVDSLSIVIDWYFIILRLESLFAFFYRARM